MARGACVVYMLVVLGIIWLASSTAPAQEPQPASKDRILYETLKDWANQSTRDEAHLKQLFPLYGLDAGLLTSRTSQDKGVTAQLFQILGRYKALYVRGDKEFARSMESSLRHLFESLKDEQKAQNLKALFADVEHVFSQYPDLSGEEVRRKGIQETLRAREERAAKEREQIMAQQQKEEEEEARRQQLAEQREEEDRQRAFKEETEARNRAYKALHQKAQQMGFKLGLCGGIADLIEQVKQGTFSNSYASKCLFTPTAADDFIVTGLVDKYVIYGDESNPSFQFSMLREPGASYGKGTDLQDGLYKFRDTQSFKMISGFATRLVVLERLKP